MILGDLCKNCGSSRSGTRTYHLERIFNTLTFPCKYFGNGCQKRFRLDKLEQHEEECQTFKMACPMRENHNCAFLGTKPQILFHCQIAHGPLTFVGGKYFKVKFYLCKLKTRTGIAQILVRMIKVKTITLKSK